MFNKKTRTYQTIRNAFASIFNRFVVYALRFASRTVFVYTLGKYYLGVSALFSSIITLLSLADLGFSIALPQSLYKPLNDGDINKIRSIINFYSKVYRIIASVVFCIGVSFLPFLDVFVGDAKSHIANIELIYFLFVLQSTFSYLFVYKRTLLIADQKNYIVVLWDTIFEIVFVSLQIVLLLLTKNYILFLSVSVITTLSCNLWTAHICDKLYPYLKNIRNATALEKKEIKSLGKKIYALVIYRVATVVELGINNIIITSLFGIVLTGLCSNYILIISSLSGALIPLMSAATPSIGNLIVSSNDEKTYKVYSMLNFISFWVYGVGAICCFILIEPFVRLWVGHDYVIAFSAVIFICLNFYISGLQNVNSNFRNAYGFFYECRYRPVLMILVNVFSSILLGKILGIAGVFLGALLSRILTVGIVDPYIVYKLGFHRSIKDYYVSHSIYHLVVLSVGGLLFFVFRQWESKNFFYWGLKGLLVFISVNLIFYLLFFKTENFKEAVIRIKGVKNAQ